MNIKGVVGNLIPIDFVKKTDRQKAKETTDRDPQQNQQGGGEPEQHRFTDEELAKALQFIKDNPGFRSNNLQLRVERNGTRVTVFVEDYTGKVIRRISDTELWALVKNGEKKSSGTLLNKAL